MFNALGVLDAGLHDMSLQEFKSSFTFTARREVIFINFAHFLQSSSIYKISTELWLDGSYLENIYWHGEADPHDIDFLMLFEEEKIVDDVKMEMQHFKRDDVRQMLRSKLLVDPYWCPNDLTDFQSYGKDYWLNKFGNSRRLLGETRIPKGIVRIKK